LSEGHFLLDLLNSRGGLLGYESPIDKSFAALEELLGIKTTAPTDLFQVPIDRATRLTTPPDLYLISSG
jgi:hypothetical protein